MPPIIAVTSVPLGAGIPFNVAVPPNTAGRGACIGIGVGVAVGGTRVVVGTRVGSTTLTVTNLSPAILTVAKLPLWESTLFHTIWVPDTMGKAVSVTTVFLR